MKKRALISVYNKDGILSLASFLSSEGWEIISTGGTAGYLQENKVSVTDISSVTGFPECLDGRVKTLHPAIHAGILARRELQNHVKTLDELGLGTIDLVCVNLYPFFEKVQSSYNDNLSFKETIEFIDIGGPSMLRSAGKNFFDVMVLTDPKDYQDAIEKIKSGDTSLQFKKYLAGKVFSLTSAYDAAIARYLLDNKYPDYLPISLNKAQSLRYGENPHQSAALYLHTDKTGVIGNMEQLHGKELGYNNIRDLDLAWKAVCAFGLEANYTQPFGHNDVNKLISGISDKTGICCAAVKHNTPCGIALGDTLLDAYLKVYACDPVSIFGGIIACNSKVDIKSARRFSELFLEIVAAPDFDDEALELLKKKKNLRIVKLQKAPAEEHEYIAVDGGILVQQSDRCFLEKWEVVSKTGISDCDISDLIFGMRAVTFVKSNAVIIVKDLAAIGIGGGQVNRIWPLKQSLERSTAVLKTASEAAFDGERSPWKDTEPARVLASDAFFPFPDIIETAAAAGIKAVIQPGGSINDKASIEACDRFGIAMVFTGTRHFKH